MLFVSWLDDLVVSVRSLCCKVTLFPFVINKYLGVGEILGD